MWGAVRNGPKPEPISISIMAAPSTDTQPEEKASEARRCSIEGLRVSPSVASNSSAGCSGTSSGVPDFNGLREALGHSDIQPGQLQLLQNVGHGSSGVVQKVLHVPSASVLALKVIAVDADEAVLKGIMLELKTLHESRHDSIVSFYGAFYREGAVHIALEYMDASLLDLGRAEGGPFAEPVLAAIARPVVQGLSYLHRELHVIHRDIKPSNILVDTAGNIKIADFGVSGNLAHTLAKCASWVGTVHYMSPERISGGSYSYDSDVWSLGITLLELAIATFPYLQSPPPRPQRLSFWDLLDFIVESPPPAPPTHFSSEFHHLITCCLQKHPHARASSTQLIEHPFVFLNAQQPLDTAAWVQSCLAKGRPRDGGALNDEATVLRGNPSSQEEADVSMDDAGSTQRCTHLTLSSEFVGHPGTTS